MSSARRPLLTATAAGTLLGALWFVPSANATSDEAARQQDSATRAAQATQTTQASRTSQSEQAAQSDQAAQSEQAAQSAGTAQDGVVSLTTTSEGETRLADTGSFDSTPYVVGGTLSLTLGAGFVVYSVRRERLGL